MIFIIRNLSYNVLWFLLWNLYIYLIKYNPSLSRAYVVFSTNLLMVVGKKLSELNLLLKVKNRIRDFEDSRIQIISIFLIDASVGMNFVMKS